MEGHTKALKVNDIDTKTDLPLGDGSRTQVCGSAAQRLLTQLSAAPTDCRLAMPPEWQMPHGTGSSSFSCENVRRLVQRCLLCLCRTCSASLSYHAA